VSRRPREHNLAASCDSGSDGSGFPAAWAGLSTPAGTCGASHARSCRRLLRDHVCVSRSQNAGIAESLGAAAGAVHLYTLSHVSSARVSIQHVLCFPFLSCSQNSVAASILYPDSERGAAQSSGRPARPSWALCPCALVRAAARAPAPGARAHPSAARPSRATHGTRGHSPRPPQRACMFMPRAARVRPGPESQSCNLAS
jgi:hypothetical protein